MRKILFLSYDFPPALAGVRRVVKLMRYLPAHGYEPLVVCAKPLALGQQDYEPLTEIGDFEGQVWRTPSLDPYHLADAVRAGAGALGGALVPGRFRAAADAWAIETARNQSPSRLTRSARRQISKVGVGALRGAMRWISPTDDRAGWVPFAVATASEIIQRYDVSAVVTTSYPNSAHLAGRILKRRFGLPWLADFRDGWMQNPYFGNWPTSFHERLNRNREAAVAREADAIVTVSQPISDHFSRLTSPAKVHTITNGYDPADYRDLEPLPFEKYTIAYTGTMFLQRTPEVFFSALRCLFDQHPGLAQEIQVVMRTQLQPEHSRLIADLGLSGVVTNLGLGTHREALQLQISADCLLLLEGNHRHADIMMTQKLFEYLAAQRPILALAPSGALATTLRRAGAGVVVAPDDVVGTTARLWELFHDMIPISPDAKFITQFDRRNIARRFARVLDCIVHETVLPVTATKVNSPPARTALRAGMDKAAL